MGLVIYRILHSQHTLPHRSLFWHALLSCRVQVCILCDSPTNISLSPSFSFSDRPMVTRMNCLEPLSIGNPAGSVESWRFACGSQTGWAYVQLHWGWRKPKSAVCLEAFVTLYKNANDLSSSEPLLTYWGHMATCWLMGVAVFFALPPELIRQWRYHPVFPGSPQGWGKGWFCAWSFIWHGVRSLCMGTAHPLTDGLCVLNYKTINICAIQLGFWFKNWQFNIILLL